MEGIVRDDFQYVNIDFSNKTFCIHVQVLSLDVVSGVNNSNDPRHQLCINSAFGNDLIENNKINTGSSNYNNKVIRSPVLDHGIGR